LGAKGENNWRERVGSYPRWGGGGGGDVKEEEKFPLPVGYQLGEGWAENSDRGGAKNWKEKKSQSKPMW